MIRGWAVWAAVLAAAGCHGTSRVAHPQPPCPTAADVRPDLPPVEPRVPEPDLSSLPRADLQTPPRGSGFTYLGLTEPKCQALAARNSSAANLLDEENRAPGSSKDCTAPADRLRREVRQLTALEFRNQSAAAALERFFQLADAEARTALAREAFPVLDSVRQKAEAAKKAGVRYPLEAADVERQLSQLAGQLEQADALVRMLNIDLRRRLGLPPGPAEERLWPTGDFGVDPEPVDAESAVATAMADRPELRAWRALYLGLNRDTLPVVRDQLRALSPLVGAAAAELHCGAKLLLALAKCLGVKPRPGPAEMAELEVRRQQLGDIIADRERAVADETRAAVVGFNAQTRRVALARDRADGWRAKLDDARRQAEAKLPGAELLEAQARLEWLKARSELAAEVMAWHQARVRVRAALGWLAWEAAPR